jgi:DNA-binding LacI/PurR family transcriptional regulator
MGALWDLPADLPIVAVEAGPQEGVPVAEVDQYQGARLATEHLLELGHPTVHHLAGPTDWSEAQQRIEGWRDSLDAAGARSYAPSRGDWSPRSGYELGRELLGQTDVTAIFVANDQMALGVLRALSERGRRVPEDISVVGFDDLPEAASFMPPLTTVHQDFSEVGRRCVDHLLRQIRSDEEETGTTLVQTSLVIRSSTAAPPRDT